jgi:DNA polymerase III delta prime subunit
MREEFLWFEKYRPQKIEDCILPDKLSKFFAESLKSGNLQNMLFTGTAGIGKTTVAKALCNELGLDYIVINASEEGNIDTLRGKIKQFASSVSLSGGYKVVILDEADYLNAQSTQPALRGFIEEFSANCRFILTCNFKNRIIEALHSRTAVIEFNIAKKDMPKLLMQFMKRLEYILSAEGIKYEKPVIAQLIAKFAPDWRRILNEVQLYSRGGTIDSGILVSLNDASIKQLMNALSDKNFKVARQWVADNIDSDSSTIYRLIYDNMYEYVDKKSIPQLVLILADYQYKNAFVADHELNVVACLVEIMAGVSFQ